MSYLFPMKAEQTAVMIESLRRMSRAVLVGGFSVAVLQGIAGGIGLALVGIPALFWGAVMAFAALVPVVGTGLVWGPAVIFLLIMGRWQSALFLALWCGVGVTSIDSFLRPYLLRGGAKVPVLFLFMAILGGVNVFGMLGILYGPMILGLVAVMLDIYAEEYHDILQNRFRNRP
jgi:predicted PurR-regulated permease PerM